MSQPKAPTGLSGVTAQGTHRRSDVTPQGTHRRSDVTAQGTHRRLYVIGLVLGDQRPWDEMPRAVSVYRLTHCRTGIANTSGIDRWQRYGMTPNASHVACVRVRDTYGYKHVCKHVHGIHMFTHMSIHMYIHMPVHMSIHMSALYMCLYKRLYMCLYIVHAYTGLYTCLHKWLCTCVYTCLYTCLHTCLCIPVERNTTEVPPCILVLECHRHVGCHVALCTACI